MPDFRFNAEMTTGGEWFLPESPHRKVSGIFHWNGRDGRLALDDSLEKPSEPEDVPAGKTYPVIFGDCPSLGAVTLFSGARTSFRLPIGPSDALLPEAIVTTQMLIGTHVEKPLYPYMEFGIPKLDVWLAVRTVHPQWQDTKEKPNLRTTIVVTPPETEWIELPTIDGSVGFQLKLKQEWDGFNNVVFGADGWLVIRSIEPKELGWFIEQYSAMFGLLAILAGCPLPADSARAKLFTSSGSKNVDLLLTMVDHDYCTCTSTYQFLFNRAQLPEFGTLVQKWFIEQPRLRRATRLASNVLASDDLWSHLEFLSLMHALEGAHRATHEGLYLTEAEYMTVEATISDAISEIVTGPLRDALLARIKFGNEISLRKRLAELRSQCPQDLAVKLLGGAGKIPDQWLDTRNYFTHWDEKLEDKVLKGIELFYANVRLRIFVRVVYLLHMKIPAEQVYAAITGNSDVAQQLIHVNHPNAPILNVKKVTKEEFEKLLPGLVENSSGPSSSE